MGSSLHLDTSLPHCPPHVHIMAAPSSFTMFLIVGVVSLVLGTCVALFYNSVGLPHLSRRIRTRAISNTLWIVYFLVVLIRSILGMVRYGLPERYGNKDAAEYVSIAGIIVHGFAAMFLALALNYQLKHRTNASGGETEALIDDNGDRVNDDDDAYPRWKKLVRFVFSSDTAIVLLLIQYLVVVFVRLRIRNQSTSSKDNLRWLQLASALLQRVPIVVLTLFIVFWVNRSLVVGPKLFQRILLFIATFINMPFDVPLSLWRDMDQATSEQCMFYIGSVVDAILTLYTISLVLYFIFLRSEFRRNAEEQTFQVVRKSQDFFDVRSFY